MSSLHYLPSLLQISPTSRRHQPANADLHHVETDWLPFYKECCYFLRTMQSRNARICVSHLRLPVSAKEYVAENVLVGVSKILVVGFVATSAPLVLSDIVVTSAIGIAVAMPCAFLFG
ncbi:hypothetical protein P8452_77823 [Trifolium repens]|nr:hypothetical protein P8452_77823 [Trifolium repens]